MTYVRATELENGSTIRGDICIIGAGAAGITIARELMGRGHAVVMLAGGSATFRHVTQMLYHGRNIGRASFAPGKARFRMLGGSTTRWSAQCRPLDAVDFEARPGLAHTGWPFARSHLEPFYRRAAEICHLDDWRFDRPLLPALDRLADWDGGATEPVRYRHGWPTDFAAAYSEELRAAKDLCVLLDTHAVEIVADAGQVRGVEARTEQGRRLRVEAGRYVLACGGIENARLLLASARSATNGLGNEHDLVGRFFMDHPFCWGGRLDLARAEDATGLEVLEGYEAAGRIQPAHAAFALDERSRREDGLNGAAVFFVRRPAHKASRAYLSAGGVALGRAIDVFSHRELPDGRLGRYLADIARHPREVTQALATRLGGAFASRMALAARMTFEALPNRESRVTLDPARRDRFGMPRVLVDWRLADGDRLGPARLRHDLGQAISASGLGRLALDVEVDGDGHPLTLEGGKHHMGTTRMHDDPRQGVVDAQCRLHTNENLFIAGSSLFPTGGYVNPTLTIVALALRLADRLNARSCPA